MGMFLQNRQLCRRAAGDSCGSQQLVNTMKLETGSFQSYKRCYNFFNDKTAPLTVALGQNGYKIKQVNVLKISALIYILVNKYKLASGNCKMKIFWGGEGYF